MGGRGRTGGEGGRRKEGAGGGGKDPTALWSINWVQNMATAQFCRLLFSGAREGRGV